MLALSENISLETRKAPPIVAKSDYRAGQTSKAPPIVAKSDYRAGQTSKAPPIVAKSDYRFPKEYSTTKGELMAFIRAKSPSQINPFHIHENK
jgi:hypothetical protein